MTNKLLFADGGQIHYSVTVACPVCEKTTQFVETTEEPVALDRDVPLDEKRHCPKCGVNIQTVSYGWDIVIEHEIETVPPTQEREAK